MFKLPSTLATCAGWTRREVLHFMQRQHQGRATRPALKVVASPPCPLPVESYAPDVRPQEGRPLIAVFALRRSFLLRRSVVGAGHTSGESLMAHLSSMKFVTGFRCRESSGRIGDLWPAAPSLIVSAIETARRQESSTPSRAGYRGCKSSRWRPHATTPARCAASSLRVARATPP
jgi:hypothetical protein